MATTTRKALREGYNRLKKTFEKIFKHNKEQTRSQLVLQPIRNRPPGLPGAGRNEKNF
jgi:hypothetical protein